MGAPAIASTRGRYAKQNRLTRVQGPGGVDVSYQYDSLGRMLTRVSGGVTTRFTWDGWNCVKEDDGTNVFRWYCPEGELHSFERNSTFYQVHSDALGSVRAITDSSGVVVGSYSYGAWGETTSASHPSGFTMPWLFVGARGVRFDPATGLHYCRDRWIDLSLARFLSRDALGSLNAYEYCLNDPVNLIDINGLNPTWPNTGGTSTGSTPTRVPRPTGVPGAPRGGRPGGLRLPGPRISPINLGQAMILDMALEAAHNEAVKSWNEMSGYNNSSAILNWSSNSNDSPLLRPIGGATASGVATLQGGRGKVLPFKRPKWKAKPKRVPGPGGGGGGSCNDKYWACVEWCANNVPEICTAGSYDQGDCVDDCTIAERHCNAGTTPIKGWPAGWPR